MIDPPIFRHFWILFVVATFANALILKIRSRPLVLQRPELADGYRKLVRGILFWGNLPWLVMAVGIEVGGVPGPFAYARPRDGNPFVLAWFACVIVLWLLGFYWLFARRGAEFLVEHPGLIQGAPQNPNTIRWLYCLMIAGGVVGLIVAFSMDFEKWAK